MGKLQLAIVMLLLSFQVGSVIPDTNPRWVRVKDVMFESPATTIADGYIVRVRLYYTDTIKMDMIVSDHSRPSNEACEILKSKGFVNNDINGKTVAYSGECVEGGVRLWPRYRNQTKYAIDEFLTKDVVHLGGATFSTEGFVDAYGEVRRFASYME